MTLGPHWVLLCSLVCLLGCDLFPEELLADASMMPATSLELGEVCGESAPRIGPEGVVDIAVDLSGLEDDVRGVEACAGAPTPGRDGFFAVEMETDDKWHFHVRSATGLDPAIYILDSTCDVRRCGPGDAIDVCGDGRDEHLSFVAPSDGVYYIGIDSRLSGDASYQLVALHPICGDDAVEHSESCDDGNTMPGDGCDDLCRAELSADSSSEVEPNDDYTAANVAIVEGGVLSVTGRLAGPCDTDLYVLTLDAREDVHVEMLTSAGEPCASPTPSVALGLTNDTGTTIRTTGAPVAPNVCPTLDAMGVPAGTYLVRVASSPDVTVLDYTLAIRIGT